MSTRPLLGYPPWVDGALAAVLRHRGESADTLVLSVPVSSRRQKTTTAMGNQVGAMLVEVSTRLGVFGWFVDRQRLVTTFVTNLRGPRSPVSFLGATVTDIIPVTSITGNVTISFAALSYAGTLAVTVIADPEHCPDLPLVVGELQHQLDQFLTPASPVRRR